MEETLGKRIVANRRRLGITQDRLAEQLGVTAQAVSKWENDQSCPDITMLPKLAEIFGVSIDALLGRAAPEPVFEGEVVTIASGAQETEPKQNKWELQYDAGSRSTLGLGLWVILAGGLLLAGNLLNWNTDLWGILWPSGLLVFGLFGLWRKFSFFRLGCCLFGGYFLLDNMNLLSFAHGKDLLLPVFLLLFGLSLLADGIRKPKKGKFTVKHNGSILSDTQRQRCVAEEEHFACDSSFGENSYRIDLPRLRAGEANISFGELTVDLSGCETLCEGCRIDASCSFGELELLVPSRYRVEMDSSTAFGDCVIKGQPDPQPEGVILLDASVSFGQITVHYI